MFTTISKERAREITENYKLCYVDSISKTYSDWSPETKEWMKTDEYKKMRDEREAYRQEQIKLNGFYSERYDWSDPYNVKHVMMDYPNPEYIRGEQEYYAYFTPISLEEQWGDDWDDSPYECNAGEPYDDIVLETKTIESGINVVTKTEEYEILRVPFVVEKDSWRVKFAEDWGYNSPFCVRDINAGAVAWIFARGDDGKSPKNAVAVNAGISPAEFVDKIEKINEMYPVVISDEEDE